eukprot:CAMPEP_0196580330 /NCGR_PEP_ID=MMETSP1081-20130531/28562_1 /TAXON_ID=36882 /ORGANISM="Pyramimonas amylifera, Strain CCMP720" /LENGTH=76 /DNA_ID=CAMNT_0041900169 /DNA_START=247 /DNA_END=477 /DNA_ORIENTATION=+
MIDNLQENVLSDFDWKMRYVIASNKISTIHQHLFRLNLFVTSSGNSILPQEIVMELSKERLDEIIMQMEQIQDKLA